MINEKGIIVHGKNTLEYDSDVPTMIKAGNVLHAKQSIALDIAPGEYSLTVGICAMRYDNYVNRANYSYYDFDALLTRVCLVPGIGPFVVHLAQESGKQRLLHHGIANLRGECILTMQ